MAFNERLGSRVSGNLQRRKGMAESWERKQELLQQMRCQLTECRGPSSLRLSDKPCIELLFKIAWFGNGKHRFVEIERFADELVTRRTDKTIARCKILDEALIAYRPELNVLFRWSFSQSVNDALTSAPAECFP
jgi:hypothetical protein